MLNRNFMHVAFILNVFPALSETFILNQITGLIDRGHEVDIFAWRHGDTSKMHPDVLRYNLLDKTYYGISIPRNIFKRFLKAAFLILSNLHKRPLVILRSLNVFKRDSKAESLRQLYEVIPFLGHDNYDIIHCHFGPNGLWAVNVRNAGAIDGKLITTFHGYDINVLPKRYGNGYYERR